LFGKRFDSFPKDTRQKEGGGQTKKYLARKMFQQKYLGFEGGLRYESTPFVLRQYYQFFKVKIYSGTDKLKTTKRQLERYISSKLS